MSAVPSLMAVFGYVSEAHTRTPNHHAQEKEEEEVVMDVPYEILQLLPSQTRLKPLMVQGAAARAECCSVLEDWARGAGAAAARAARVVVRRVVKCIFVVEVGYL